MLETSLNLLRLSLVTAKIAVVGLILGLVFALILFLFGQSWKKAGWIANTLAVAVKSAPAFAFVPLIAFAFGPGLATKAIVAGCICFFPIFVSLDQGTSKVPEGIRRITRCYGSSRWRTYWFVYRGWLVRAALEGVQSAAPLAVVGALVAEFVDAASTQDMGLGVFLYLQKDHLGSLSIGLVVGTALGMVLYALAACALWFVGSKLNLEK